jgi:hypothetical protein
VITSAGVPTLFHTGQTGIGAWSSHIGALPWVSSSTSPTTDEEHPMNTRTLTYRTSTAITAFVLLSGGVTYLLGAEWAVTGVTALGYPAYLVTILGVWKVLGAVAIAAPGYPRLKEWAYAGVAFDLSGAAVSHLASGSAAVHVVVPVTLLAVAALSWATRPASRRLAGPVGQDERVPATV